MGATRTLLSVSRHPVNFTPDELSPGANVSLAVAVCCHRVHLHTFAQTNSPGADANASLAVAV